MVNGNPVAVSDNGQNYKWTPEMEVDLTNDNGDEVKLFVNQTTSTAQTTANVSQH